MKALEFNPEEWTQEELAERQQKVSEMLKRNEPTAQEQDATEKKFAKSAERPVTQEEMREANDVIFGFSNALHQKPTRAPRSDKGKKRKPEPEPEPQRAGVLTHEQAGKLRSLTNAELKAHLALAEAERNMEKASNDVLDFLDSLTKL